MRAFRLCYLDRKNIRQKRTFGILRNFGFTSFPSTFDTNGLVVSGSCSMRNAKPFGAVVRQKVEDGKTGFLCVESAHSIKNTLNTIMENKELLKTVGKNAQSQIYISWEDAVKKV